MKVIEINQQMALEQDNVTLTHFLLLIYFTGNRFPTVILADVAIQQWWINVLEIWSRTRYDVMMVWWYDDTRIQGYKDIEQWFAWHQSGSSACPYFCWFLKSFPCSGLLHHKVRSVFSLITFATAECIVSISEFPWTVRAAASTWVFTSLRLC